MPYDIIRGIITATCGVVFGLFSSSYFNSVKKEKLYKQLVVNLMYDMNRTCNQSKYLYETLVSYDSLYARIDSLYSVGKAASVTDDEASDMVMLMAMPLHPLSYNTIEGVFRADFQTIENIDNVELESMIGDFFAVRDQYNEIFNEYNAKIEHVWNTAILTAKCDEDKCMVDAMMNSQSARHFMRNIHCEYSKMLGKRLKSMQKEFAKILKASDVTIDDLNQMSLWKTGKPLKIKNPFLKEETDKPSDSK